MSQKLRPPPFAKEFLQFKGRFYYIFIFMGVHAWTRANTFRHPYFPSTLVLPPGESPFDFIWPVRDQDVYLLNTSPTNDAYVREVVGCLFNAGAKSIQYVGVDTPVTEFKKGA